MLDISTMLEEIESSPYEEISIKSPHTGVVVFPEDLPLNTFVYGPSGDYKEVPGSLLFTLTREKLDKPVNCPEKGELVYLAKDLNGSFVEAGTELAKVRHFLSKDDVVAIILKRALSLFLAPERAKYYFTPAFDVKIKAPGTQPVSIRNGDELFIMSRMKREMPLSYSGPDGVIYAVYFNHNQNVDIDQPLIGVCPPDMVPQIESAIMRVQTEWKEQNG